MENHGVSEMPSVVVKKKEQDSLPDISKLSLNKDDVRIDYYLVEENSEGEEKIVLLKSFTEEEEKNCMKGWATGKEQDASGQCTETSKSESNCSSSALLSTTSSVVPVLENGGYDTEDDVSQDILPMNNYQLAGVAAEVLSDYENRCYKPLYTPEFGHEISPFQPKYQQQQPPKEIAMPSGMNFACGFSTPPRQNLPMQFQQNNYVQAPTLVTPFYTPFLSSGDYNLVVAPLTSAPFTYDVLSSPIIPISTGFSFHQQVATMVPSSSGLIPGFTNYSPPTATWINKPNPVKCVEPNSNLKFMTPPECFPVQRTNSTIVDYGHTFYCMGEELPFVSNSGQAHFRNQVVSSAQLNYKYYVPPRVEIFDFFGGQQNLWQIKMIQYFSRFKPTIWRLQALPDVVHYKENGWGYYSLRCKFKFKCKTCNYHWTKKRGTTTFTFCLNTAVSMGLVFMKEYGQVCRQQGCADQDFQRAANYPEEIDRVMKKLSHVIGHICYKIPFPTEDDDQNN